MCKMRNADKQHQSKRKQVHLRDIQLNVETAWMANLSLNQRCKAPNDYLLSLCSLFCSGIYVQQNGNPHEQIVSFRQKQKQVSVLFYISTILTLIYKTQFRKKKYVKYKILYCPGNGRWNNFFKSWLGNDQVPCARLCGSFLHSQSLLGLCGYSQSVNRRAAPCPPHTKASCTTQSCAAEENQDFSDIKTESKAVDKTLQIACACS